MRWMQFTLVVGLVVTLAACGDDTSDSSSATQTQDPKPAPAEAPAVAEIGKSVKTFQVKDLDGKAFDSANPGYTRAEAEAAVAAAAKDQELGSEEFAAAAGMPFGIQASEEAAATLTSKEAAVDWIMKAKDQPIVYMVWSPNCPTSRKYNDRIHELVQDSGVRMYAIDGNHGDSVEGIRKFAERMGFPMRTFMDKSLNSIDILGGKRTPQFMLVDTKGVLRYRGGFNNDPSEIMEDDEREDWLADAIAAVQKGEAVARSETEPSG